MKPAIQFVLGLLLIFAGLSMPFVGATVMRAHPEMNITGLDFLFWMAFVFLFIGGFAVMLTSGEGEEETPVVPAQHEPLDVNINCWGISDHGSRIPLTGCVGTPRDFMGTDPAGRSVRVKDGYISDGPSYGNLPFMEQQALEVASHQMQRCCPAVPVQIVSLV